MENKNIAIFIAVILIIIAGLFLFNSFLKNDVNVTEDMQTEEDVAENKTAPVISVPTQASGDSVFVERAVLPDGGFVVIYKEVDGRPGVVIGVSPFLPAGTSSNFQISLSEDTSAGATLYAILHSDDGNGEFDINVDSPMVYSSGNVIFNKFSIVDTSEFDNVEKL